MKLINDDQHRAISFIGQLNAVGYRPSSAEVEQWLASPAARVPASTSFADLAGLAQLALWVKATMSTGVRESVTEHLVRIGWAATSSAASNSTGLVLTDIGTALLRAADARTESGADVQAVVLDANSPLSYPRLIGALAAAGAGTLIDPWMHIEGVHHIINATNISRILMSKQRKGSAEVRAMISTYLAADLPRTIEVRASSDPQLHDRYIVSESEAVTQLGSSINGVASGTTTTLLIPLTGPACEAVKVQVRKWWSEAEPVKPTPPLSAPEPGTDSA